MCRELFFWELSRDDAIDSGWNGNRPVLGGKLPPSFGWAISQTNGPVACSTLTATNVIRIIDEELAASERRAREAFCLLLLNLNEVVYVN